MATAVSQIATGRPEGIGREPGNRLPGFNPVITDPLVVLRNGQPVDWLGDAINVVQPINGFPTCSLGVRIAKGYAVNTGTEAVPNYVRIEDAVTDADEIIVKTAREDPSLDVELFRGNLAKITRSTTGADQVNLDLEFIGTELDQNLDYALVGTTRLAIRDVQQTEPTEQSYDKSDPLVFNPRGEFNCYQYRIPGPNNFEMPIFWSPRVAGAQAWSWARVFMHLLGRARIGIASSIGRVPAITESIAGEYADWNLQSIIIPIDDDGTNLLERDLAIDPVKNPQMESNPWLRILWGKPDSFVAEGLSWWEALKAAAMQTGIGFVWEHRRNESGEGRWGLRFLLTDIGLAEEYGRRVEVYLPGNAYTTHDKDWGDVRADANLASFTIASDYTKVVNTKALIGSPYEYEITSELVPLWPVNSDWDVNTGLPQEVSNAISASALPAFEAKYRTDGPQHVDDNTLVGRAWGLNTTGRFDNFGRSYPPFEPSRYERFDLDSVDAGEAQQGDFGGGTGFTILKNRPFSAMVTTDANSKRRQPLIEISFDSGATWQPSNLDAEISGFDALVLLKVANLADVVNRSLSTIGTNQENFVNAYISGQLRLRITATIHGDFIVDVPRATIDRTLSNKERGKIYANRNAVRRMRDFRNGFSGGNSQFAESNQPAAERDDTDTAQAALYASLYSSDRVGHVGTVQLPELVFFTGDPNDNQNNSGYRPGDILTGVFDNSGQDAGLFNFIIRANQQEIGALIGSIAWTYSIGNPESGGMASRTQLTLESLSHNTALRQSFARGLN